MENSSVGAWDALRGIMMDSSGKVPKTVSMQVSFTSLSETASELRSADCRRICTFEIPLHGCCINS